MGIEGRRENSRVGTLSILTTPIISRWVYLLWLYCTVVGKKKYYILKDIFYVEKHYINYINYALIMGKY